MSIPHLKARAEFYALCLEHGPENVEWVSGHAGYALTWDIGISKASECAPRWREENTYAFRLRPRTVVIPEAVVPEEDKNGEYELSINISLKGGTKAAFPPMKYATEKDMLASVEAMMRRREKR